MAEVGSQLVVYGSTASSAPQQPQFVAPFFLLRLPSGFAPESSCHDSASTCRLESETGMFISCLCSMK